MYPTMEGEVQSAEQSALEAPSDQALRVPYYCEENVWRLAVRKRQQQPTDQFWAVFISNYIKNVPMFQQKAAASPDVSCCWDYHVILLCHRTGETILSVYDIDSLLPYPCPLDDYLAQSFPYDWPYPYGPMFRVVPMDAFLQNFASDRSHMIDKQGNWQAPPPSYAPIGAGNNNLQSYLSFQNTARDGSEDGLVYGKFFSKAEFGGADLSTLP